MEKKELIYLLLDMVDQYDKLQNHENAWNKEIQMWRTRFLESNSGFEKNPVKRNTFLLTPSDSFMKTSPEELFRKLSEFS